MPLLPLSKAACKLTGHTWGSWLQLLRATFLVGTSNPELANLNSMSPARWERLAV
jgi:hypothetical protein